MWAIAKSKVIGSFWVLLPVFAIATPFYWDWKLGTLGLFFGYNWLAVGSSFSFSLLYSLSFTTLLWWVWFPLDLAIANALSQLVCIYFTGATIHGKLSDLYNNRSAK